MTWFLRDADHVRLPGVATRRVPTALGLVALVVFSMASLEVHAKDYGVRISVQSASELYALVESGDLDAESVDILVALIARPLDLNRADERMLIDLPGITYELARAIIEVRGRAPFTSVDELGGVPGMTPSLLADVRPFVQVTDERGEGSRLPWGIGGVAEAGSVLRKGFVAPWDETARQASTVEGEIERGAQGYLKLAATGVTYYGAGLLATYRARTRAAWDESMGQLVSPGPGSHLDLERAYVFGSQASTSFILGSYNVGFGEGLVFDTTGRELPHGWVEDVGVLTDFEVGGVAPRRALWGGAVTLEALSLGVAWIDATAFVSYANNDVYQYDFNYGLDDGGGTASCTTDGDCPDGYTCGDDQVCRSSRVYDQDDDSIAFRYVTLEDAYREALGGGHVTLHFDEAMSIGLTGYAARADFSVAEEADANFSFSARMPREASFGVVGANARLDLGRVEFGAEAGMMLAGGLGLLLRSIVTVGERTELAFSARSYSPDFENPHGSPQAARDEAFGLSARNERGLKVELDTRPWIGVESVTVADVWTNPYAPVIDADGLRWVPRDEALWDLSLSQRLTLRPTSSESVGLVLSFDDKDLARGGREQTYELGDGCSLDNPDECGAGEKRRAQLTLGSERLRWLEATLTVQRTWQDTAALDDDFDRELQTRLRLTVRPIAGTRIVAYGVYWSHNVPDTSEATSDREEPAVTAWLELEQKLGELFSLTARYGVVHYRDDRPERWADYHVAKAVLEAKF